MNSEKSFISIREYIRKDTGETVLLYNADSANILFIPEGAKIKEYEIMINADNNNKCLDYDTVDDLGRMINDIVKGNVYGFLPAHKINKKIIGRTCNISIYKIIDNSM